MTLIYRVSGRRAEDVTEAQRKRKALRDANWDSAAPEEPTEEMYLMLDAAVSNVPRFVDYEIVGTGNPGPGAFVVDTQIDTDDERYEQSWFWGATEGYWDPR